MRLLYNFGIKLYLLIIRLFASWNPKARKWVNGRQNIFENLKNVILKDDKIVWFHAASLGEFEQGRPIIEEFKKKYPSYKLLLTFFSPSGYEVRKNYKGVDYIFYLPADTPSNVKKFLDIVNPQIAVFVKYEFWFNYIQELDKRNIPLFIVSAIFRQNQHFFKPYGTFFRSGLKKVKHFFVQNEASGNLLKSIGINNYTVSGDTRFDRVADIINQDVDLPVIQKFCKDKRVVVAGSTWPKDEIILKELLDRETDDFRLLLAPHEIHKNHLDSIKQLFGDKAHFYSDKNIINSNAKVLIIDCIGLLSKLYRFGQVTYIGGGFGVGIHNTLEAAVYGKPVFFGPNYDKFDEAKSLISIGAAFSINSSLELSKQLELLWTANTYLKEVSNKAYSFVQDNKGATTAFMKHLEDYNL
ncbi:MAG: 3-deoxy-D-manno-octulosonic acid transferase [Hyphomicrobiales bacterium]